MGKYLFKNEFDFIMNNKNKIAKIIIIGCGPHARRVYIPSIRKIKHIKLELIIDLKSQESVVRSFLNDFAEIDLHFIEPFEKKMPNILSTFLNNYIIEKEISGVIIATEPLIHKIYADWALQAELNILIDKPITARANSVSDKSSAKGIYNDFVQLFEKYKSLQLKKETIFMINSQRRYHEGFEFVMNKIREVSDKTNCPVTFISAYHCDGQWRLPNEIITQQYHPYCTGYGKASHSGYHIFDTIYQLYKSSGITEKFADSIEIMSSFIQPNGFFNQLNENDYNNIFGDQYNLIAQYNDEELKNICTDYGEVDLSAIITLKKNNDSIANFSLNLLHNGFAGRTWIKPGEDLYKGNGRIKHESYTIQQGPFQNIQIHAYQSSDNHDLNQGPENFLGGKNHFEIYIFRNPLVSNSQKQPEVFSYKDIIDLKKTENDSIISMEYVKFKVVKEFADYLIGKRKKININSQIEDHIIPVKLMSGIYLSSIMKKHGSKNVVKYPWNYSII